jgi:hypothetical protein
VKRQYVNLTEAQFAALKARAEVHGSPVSEEIRRAVVAYTSHPAIGERLLCIADIGPQGEAQKVVPESEPVNAARS